MKTEYEKAIDAQEPVAWAAARADMTEPQINVAGMPEFDALLDHIYEYGTASEGIVDRANAFARALLSHYGRHAGDAQPVAWVAADTLNSPHPTCVSSLAYMSQLDREQGREYVPLYAAPVAAQTADAGLDVEAVLRLFLTGDGFIAECDIPHIVAALTAQPAVGEEIMVNAAHDVYTLPLQPSGLDGQGPRFVVHVPAQADPANTKERSMNEAERLLQALVTALDAAFISRWQSTAYWQGELDDAREYLEARTQGASHG